MRKLKYQSMLAISFLFILFCGISFFREDVPFPFVQYQMFHRLVPNPVTTVYQVFGVEKNGSELLLDRNFVRPMSVREVFEIYNFEDLKVKNALMSFTLKRAHQLFPHFNLLRFYQVKCSCADFYQHRPALNVNAYTQQFCGKKLLKEETFHD